MQGSLSASHRSCDLQAVQAARGRRAGSLSPHAWGTQLPPALLPAIGLGTGVGVGRMGAHGSTAGLISGREKPVKSRHGALGVEFSLQTGLGPFLA